MDIKLLFFNYYYVGYVEFLSKFFSYFEKLLLFNEDI